MPTAGPRVHLVPLGRYPPPIMVTPGFQALDMTSYLFRPPCLEDEPSNELALATTHSCQVRPVHLSQSLAALNEADSIASVPTTLPLRQTPQGRLLKIVVKKDGKGSVTRPRCPCQEGRAQKGDSSLAGGNRPRPDAVPLDGEEKMRYRDDLHREGSGV